MSEVEQENVDKAAAVSDVKPEHEGERPVEASAEDGDAQPEHEGEKRVEASAEDGVVDSSEQVDKEDGHDKVEEGADTEATTESETGESEAVQVLPSSDDKEESAIKKSVEESSIEEKAVEESAIKKSVEESSIEEKAVEEASNEDSIEKQKAEDDPLQSSVAEVPCEESSEPAQEKPVVAQQASEIEVKVECGNEKEKVTGATAEDTTQEGKNNDEVDGEIEVIAADTVKPKKKKRRPRIHIGPRSHKKYPLKHMIRLEVVKPSKNKSTKSLEIAVYLIEKTGRLLTIDQGVVFTAGQVLNKMIENLSLPPEASRVFSIWLSSPYLELQLKPHHKPCELRKQWSHLLSRFTTATEEQISRDEPILSFQRNAFYTVAEEKQLTEDGIIKRLFEEAKYNFLTCQYPVSQEDAEMLGSILVYLEHGPFDQEKHSTTEFLNHNLRLFLPPYTWKSRWPLATYWTKRQENQRLLDAYKEVSAKLSTQKSGHLAFLQFCWTLPYYGSVFFHGQVEREATKFWHTLFGHPDIPVFVALNSEGIHIIEDSSNEILLGLTYDDLSWDYLACDEKDVDCMDTLYLEYDEDDQENEGHKLSTQLSVFSKQAIMMDAMIQTCTSCHQAGILPSAEGAFKRSHSKRMERVSVTAYTEEGEPFVRNKPTNFSLSKPLRRLKRHSGSEPAAPEK